MPYYKIILLFISLILLTSCDITNTTAEQQPKPSAKQTAVSGVNQGINPTRFTVESHGQFNGGHRNNEREIFIITDKETDRKYLAITGCGVSELYNRQSGKQTITDDE